MTESHLVPTDIHQLVETILSEPIGTSPDVTERLVAQVGTEYAWKLIRAAYEEIDQIAALDTYVQVLDRSLAAAEQFVQRAYVALKNLSDHVEYEGQIGLDLRVFVGDARRMLAAARALNPVKEDTGE